VAAPVIPPGFDLTDPDIGLIRVPAEELAELRRAAPVWWVAQRRGSAGFDDEGYWAVTRHADILAISKNPEVYSSCEDTALIRYQEGTPRESIEIQRIILLNMDPPDDTKQRGIVSRGFTPRAIGNLRQALAYEEALARVSRRVAALARQSAAELRAERLAAARAARQARGPGAPEAVSDAGRTGPAVTAGPTGDRALHSPASKKRRASTRAAGARQQAKRDSR
jgi:cytochrome P450